MPAEKMHKDEVDTDAASMGRLLANQFPQWADLPVEPVAWSLSRQRKGPVSGAFASSGGRI
jgi:hypothetical protein